MHRDDIKESGLVRRTALGRLLTIAGVGSAVIVPESSGLAASQTDRFRQPGPGAVDRSVGERLLESISLADFGYRGDGVSDDLPAWRAALAEATRRGVGRLTVPFGKTGVSLVNGSIVDGPWPVGLVIEAVGSSGLTQSYHNGIEIRYTGSGICWNCDTTGIPQQRGGSVHFYGRTTWRGLGFRCTDPAGTMFAFNERALRDWAERGIEPAGRCDVASFMRWESCTFLGAGGGKRQRGDAIRGALVFQSVVDEGCEIREWRRGVHLLCSDNNNLHGRLSFCGRNVMIESTPGGGNDNMIHGPWIGPSVKTIEPSYPVWDTGKTTTLLRVSIEQDVADHAVACIYLNGANTMLLMPCLYGARVFHMGPDCTNGMILKPVGGRQELSWAPIIDAPSTYEGSPGHDRRLTIIEPDDAFLGNASLHPRLRYSGVITSTIPNVAPQNLSGSIIDASGARPRRWGTDAFTYRGQTVGSAPGFATGPIWSRDPSNRSTGWSLVLQPPGNSRIAGWEELLVVGRDVVPGDLLQLSIRSRVRSSLRAGSFAVGWIRDGILQWQNSVQSPTSQSSDYRTDRFLVDLKNAVLGETISIFFCVQPGTDQDVLIEHIIYEAVCPAIHDTKAPPTAAQFNLLLSALRRVGVIAA